MSNNFLNATEKYQEGSFLEKQWTIVVADDHDLVLSSMKQLFTPLYRSVLTAKNFSELINILQNHLSFHLVILLDLDMPGLMGVESIYHIKRYYPDVKIVILSATQDRALIIRYLDIGVHAYLSKIQLLDDIKKTVTQVIYGKIFTVQETLHNIGLTKKESTALNSAPSYENKRNFHEVCQNTLIDFLAPDKEISPTTSTTQYVQLKTYTKAPVPLAEYEEILPNFSVRQMEIIWLLAKGVSNKYIAEKLYIEVSTVKTHISDILKTVGVKKRTEVFSAYFRLHKIDPIRFPLSRE